ncbi:MAG: S-formylglutathione hydrolase [marine bacterium B5-7]|nr:MAG: S-formylglutathione hydrolase [marine bacterium B5-7]
MEVISENRCFDGTQGIYKHQSSATGTAMRFAVYTPPASDDGPVPVLWYLSGLTCTEENFIHKAGAQRYAAEHGIMLVAPDTSPRGAGIEGEDDDYDFGSGAGFYVDATVDPWSKNYRMYSYISQELPGLIFDSFAADVDRQGICGHSMGGHGALTIALKHPDIYRSVSAFAPICAPSQCPWGQKALTGYLGENRKLWEAYDATALVESGARTKGTILIDQGSKDDFLERELMPERFVDACERGGQKVRLRMHLNYDHSYYFIATFIGDHIRFHAEAFKRL